MQPNVPLPLEGEAANHNNLEAARRSKMTPREFLEKVVRPNLIEFYERFGDIRMAYNAIASVDSLAAHIYFWCETNAPSEIQCVPDDNSFRRKLGEKNQDCDLLRDAAKAQKHVRLTQVKSKRMTFADQIKSGHSNGYFGRYFYGLGGYFAPKAIFIETDDGRSFRALDVIVKALAFLENEMQRLSM